MNSLHSKQSRILQLLKENVDTPLSMAQLTRLAEINSPGVFYHHLRQLEVKGYLKRNPDNPADYIVFDAPERKVVYINKYGIAKCGPEGIFIDDNVEDQIPVASSLLRFPCSEAFIVEAKGDSMEPKIVDGDIVIGRRQNSVENGDIVICSYEEKGYIKQFWKTGAIFLASLNQKYPPIAVKDPSELRIAGVVKNILKYT